MYDTFLVSDMTIVPLTGHTHPGGQLSYDALLLLLVIHCHLVANLNMAQHPTHFFFVR